MPGTLVTFHAHPDDEAIATGGVMARAAAAGHRVVLVVATGGELGEVAPGVLADGEALAAAGAPRKSRAPARCSASRGSHFWDTGIRAWRAKQPTPPRSVRRHAAVDEAAARLAEILREEDADVLTVYDENGNYGHPDHIQVHHVGVTRPVSSMALPGSEATLNRNHVAALMQAPVGRWGEIELAPDPDDFTMGMPASAITTTVDVGNFVAQKRAAMQAHASQIPEDSFFLQLPPDAFREAFGYEWFIRHGPRPRNHETWLFDHS